MFIKEYGDKNDPLVVLLAPMMVSGEELYQLIHPCFKENYHFIAPDQGGHGKAEAYVSADEEYKTLKSFLLDVGHTEIELIYGASMGVAVGYRLFLDPDLTVHHAWFDGVALSRNAGFAEWFMKHMFRSRKKKLARTRVEASPSLVQMYGYDFAKMMTKNFERITESDIDAICHACCHYDLRKLTGDEQARLHLDFGEKDFDWKYSKKTIPVYMPDAELVIRPGYQHCAYMAALSAAQCDDILEKLPDGMDTVIGTEGTYLSGGEQQRVALARAILKNAPIVVLDEATASLDVENETKVQGALSRLLQGKTVLVIAHRMRTVEAADKIVVLAEGKVAEEGSPAELLNKKDGLFRRMALLQSASAGWSL